MLAHLITLVALGVLVSTEPKRLFESNVFYVKPNKITTCKETPCNTLLWYVSRGSNYFKSHSIMIFLEGEHALHNKTAYIANVNNLSMIGYSTVKSQTTFSEYKITCDNTDSGFIFVNSCNILVSQLTFEKCGAYVSNYQPFNEGVKHLLPQIPITAAIAFIASKNVSLTGTVLHESYGHGLHAYGCTDNFAITNSVFAGARAHKKGIFTSIANAYFWYTNCSSKDNISLQIKDSWFVNGLANGQVFVNKRQYGVGLSLQLNCSHILVFIDNVTVQNNSWTNDYGANLGINIMNLRNSDIRVKINNSRLVDGEAKKGGGLILLFYPSDMGTNSSKLSIEIENTVFDGNKAIHDGGAVYMKYYELLEVNMVVRQVTFFRCNFTRNHFGDVVNIINHRLFPTSKRVTPQLAILFQECVFSGNNLTSPFKNNIHYHGVLSLYSMQEVTIKESKFVNNYGTATLLTSSSLIFEGQNLFKGNYGDQGGALTLQDNSQLLLHKNTQIIFSKNKAGLFGGAIYVEQPSRSPPCFFQPEVKNVSTVHELGELIKLEFINNSAEMAGHGVYGGSIDSCFTLQQFSVDNKPGYFESTTIFNTIFHFNTPHPSLIASNPESVCTCSSITNSVNCSQRTMTIDTFAGKTFSMSVSAVGQRNGTFPSGIKVLCTDTSVIFHQEQNIVNNFCTDIKLTIYTMTTSVRIALFPEQATVSNNPYTNNYTIQAELQPCPWMFELHNNKCACNHILSGLTCDINTKSIKREKSHNWIGCLDTNFTNPNETEPHLQCKIVAISNNCNADYCSSNTGFMNVSKLYSQCAQEREGIMCGSCSAGYSLALGPLSKCVDECQPWKPFLLLGVFGFAGIMLVAFLFLFNLTVSEGTINGLIFYANIVHANQKSFFPATSVNSNKFFYVFIAWLNLDFGFEVCFYEGMDAFQKQWWEFGFVMYILFLELTIILLSRRFIFFTRIMGRNAVNILSTLLLLVYPKLLRSSLKSLQFSDLHLSDNTHKLVWHFDGNIDYFQRKHIPLGIVASILLTVVFNFAISLLFIQCLQRHSSRYLLRWVEKLKPFFDSYTGPCRDNYRFWPGLLLFLRFALFSIYTTSSSNVKLYLVMGFCTFIFILACVSPNGVYKKWPLNVLEFSFILNLGFLSGFVVSNLNVPTPIVFTYPSVAIAMLTFIGILTYHGYKQITATRMGRRVLCSLNRRPQRQWVNVQRGLSETNEIHCDNLQSNAPMPTEHWPTATHFNELREPLLTDN